MIISGGDLAIFLFAVGAVLVFFTLTCRMMSKAERAETSEDEDP
jgi:hypothetical protein